MTLMKRIGLYGGTFDPIHFGHLNLAIELMEKHRLDEVWFIPAQISPHKLDFHPVPVEHRMSMLNLAIEDIPQFFVKDFEHKRPPPSYTIHTLKEILNSQEVKASPHHFYLLMGEDSVLGFFRWHLPEEIIKMVPLLIATRLGQEIKKIDAHSEIYQAIQKGLSETRLIDISSTDVRHRLANSLYCGHLVPHKVLEYIAKNQLYTKLKC